MTRSYLITGGAGFLGSHLVERLLERGARVVVLDDLSTGRRANLAAAEGREGFAFVRGSAMDVELVRELVAGVDEVIHLAAAVGVQRIVERPVDTIVTNVEATRVVLEVAADPKAPCPVFLASTSEVYGKSAAVPFREDADVSLGATTRSRWSYACSKALDEWLALAYFRERGVPVRIARFFNVVGPRQVGRYGMVLPRFARQALRGAPITVYGDGTQTRCFAHVADVVEAVERLLDCPRAVGAVVNVGSDEEVSIGELARRVRDLAGAASEIVLVPYEEAYAAGFEDMQRRVPDLERLRSWVGGPAPRPLDATIRDVLAAQRSALSV